MSDELKITLITSVITLIMALGVNGVGWMLWKNQRNKLVAESANLDAESKKLDAEADDIVLRSALTMVKELKDQMKEQGEKIESLTARVTVLEDENKALLREREEYKCGAILLEEQVEKSGGTPVYRVRGRVAAHG